MVKVSVEVRNGTARFELGVQAENIQGALGVVAEWYPADEFRVKFPIDPKDFFVKER